VASKLSSATDRIARATADVTFAFDTTMEAFFHVAEKSMKTNELTIPEMRLIIDYNCGPDIADAFEEYMED
jgi:hypothetical protein